MNKFMLKMPALLILIFLTSCGNSGKKNSEVVVKAGQDKTDTIKPIVNVYIENSGSMDGFVNRGNEFTTFVASYLTDISISFSNDINLHYINSRIIPLGKDITDFTNKLDASTFNEMGGSRGETHIFQLLDTILKVTDNNAIAIFITDGIFSPGRSRDANKYIVDQYNGIKKSFADYFKKNPNTAVVVFQPLSQFFGTFYDRNDRPLLNTREVLPYYVWLIGDIAEIKALMANVQVEKVKYAGNPNVFSITGGNKEIDYAVKRGSGNFRLDRSKPKKEITKLRKDKRTRQVKFSVDADLSGFLLDDSYLLDPNNYALNNSNYKFHVKKAVSNPHGYTHTFDFSADKVHKGNVNLTLKSKIPQWVENVNDDEGVEAIQGKTFGIKYQINGVFEAFTFNNNKYTEITINIK